MFTLQGLEVMLTNLAIYNTEVNRDSLIVQIVFSMRIVTFDASPICVRTVAN